MAEVNFGGEMVREIIREADALIPVVTVRATRGKYLRAEPVAQLYEQGRVRHAGVFAALEDEMCDFGLDGLSSGRSPDRLDTLVWAITAFKLRGQGGAAGEGALTRPCLPALLAFGFLCLAALLLRRRLGRRHLHHHFAGNRVGEAEPAAEVLEMLAHRVENAAHQRPRGDDILEARPFADEAEGALAGPDQRAAAEAFEPGVEAAMRGDELLLVPRPDAKTHNIKRRHVPLPRLKA